MKIWLAGARPRTLPAAIAPVLIGTSLINIDGEAINWINAMLALLVGLLLQVAVNYSNDYSDGVRGTDEVRVGPIRLVASGLKTPSQVKNAALLTYFIASICGLFLALRTSPLLIIIGAFAILAGWKYTGGKNPYGYNGFGEISVFIFFGLVATIGTYYVQAGEITLLSFIVAIPMGALACAILAVNNIRDRAQDELSGKRTLAVRLGDVNARLFYVSLLVFAHVAAIATLIPTALLTLMAVPMSYSISKSVLSGVSGKDLIPALGRTGKLQLVFAILFALGIAIQ